MLSRPCHPVSRFLRLMALAVLALGMLTKPMIVAACELEDLGLALASATPAFNAVEAPTGDACCPGQTCGECCTVSVAVPVAPAVGAAMPPTAIPQAAAWVKADPAPLSVAIRPPIAA